MMPAIAGSLTTRSAEQNGLEGDESLVAMMPAISGSLITRSPEQKGLDGV